MDALLFIFYTFVLGIYFYIMSLAMKVGARFCESGDGFVIGFGVGIIAVFTLVTFIVLSLYFRAFETIRGKRKTYTSPIEDEDEGDKPCCGHCNGHCHKDEDEGDVREDR